MRLRLAPMALRTTISVSRVAARANSRSATFEHRRTTSSRAKTLNDRSNA
jgi:hypothetical protein